MSFAYRNIAPELKVFVMLHIKLIKAANFIYTLKKKQKVWYKIVSLLAISNEYFNIMQKPSPFKSPLFSQSEAFFCHQT